MNIWCCVLLGILICSCNGASILAVFPSPGYDQYAMGSFLMQELASRGHRVLVISPYRQNAAIENYEEIAVEGVRNLYEERNFFEYESFSPYAMSMEMHGSLGPQLAEEILKNAQVQRLLHSDARFDLVICEQFFNEAHLGFGHHFNAPIVLLSFADWTSHLVGNPLSFSVYPTMFSAHSDTMDFKQRLRNAWLGFLNELYARFVAFPKQNKILQSYLPEPPDLNELLYGASLVLLNTDYAVGPVLSRLPNMIEIGGFHIEPNGLPNDLKTFLDAASNGAIYFSMGRRDLNNVNISEGIANSILDCFSTLKQSVLWKWKDSTSALDNIKIRRWFPQNDILAHPNVRLFITHGDMSSIIEAIHNGIPIIGIPIFGEQKRNIALAVSEGYGLKVPFKRLSEKTLCNAINEMLTNFSYRVEAKKRSDVLKDRPMEPLEKAIFWIEYVIRNRGAPYLRSATLNLNWFQYYLMDVVLCMILIACLGVLVSILLLKLLFAKKKGRKQHTKRD